MEDVHRGELGDDQVARAIRAAARREMIRFGLARANVDDIARLAGVSRVTVYRRFDSKAQLLRSVIMEDLLGALGNFDGALFAEGSVESRVEEAVLVAIQHVRDDALLSTALRADSGPALQSLTIDGQATFDFLRDQLAARIGELVDRGDIVCRDRGRTAEIVLRIGYSVVLLPFGLLPGAGDDEIREFAREFIVPLLTRPLD